MKLNKKEQPIVSIIMPAYNAERFLAKAIESILSQSFKDFEFLIMNDGSTDSTWQILQDYREKDIRIKLFQQENKGVAVSLNYLISQSRGEFIARMDADDISHPDRLQQQTDYLMQYPDTGMLSTAKMKIAPNGLSYTYTCPPDNQNALINLFFKGINPIVHGSVMFRKTVLMALNEPPYKLIRKDDFEDIDLWKRLIKVTTLAVIKKPLYYMREYSGSVTDRYIQDNTYQGTASHFDHKVALILKKNLIYDRGFEYFLNAKALFLNRKYLLALINFFQVFFCKKNKYWIKSFLFIGLTFLGSLGIFIYHKLKKKEPWE